MENSVEIINTLPETLLPSMIYIGVFGVILLLAKWVKDVFTPYSLNLELSEHDNFAIALTMAGYYLAVALIFASQLSGPTISLKTDVINVTLFSLLGLLVLNLSRWVNDKFILRTFCNIEKLTKEQDTGVGAVQFSIYVATGLIASGALQGEGSIWTFIGFFALGQLCLILFGACYNLFAPFDLYRELEKKNLSAAIAYAGTTLAFGLIIMHSVSGDFVAWSSDLPSFAISAALGFVFLPVLLRLTDRLIIPGKSLRKEIVEDSSLAAGALEATIALSFALIIIQLV